MQNVANIISIQSRGPCVGPPNPFPTPQKSEIWPLTFSLRKHDVPAPPMSLLHWRLLSLCFFFDGFSVWVEQISHIKSAANSRKRLCSLILSDWHLNLTFVTVFLKTETPVYLRWIYLNITLHQLSVGIRNVRLHKWVIISVPSNAKHIPDSKRILAWNTGIVKVAA